MTTNEVLAIALKALKNGGGGGGGTSNYNSLENKPKINGVVLQGNKTSAELHIDMSSLITADFDGTQNYAVGDIVIYQGNLYRFIQAHSAGAWDANDVELVTVVELIGEKATTVKISQAAYNALTKEQQRADYYDVLKIIALIIIKINQEFCYRYQER